MTDHTRLTYSEVQKFVSFLPDTALAELAKGPLPDEPQGTCRASNCRVCAALDPFTSSGPANVLLEWHDLTTKSFKLLGDIIDRPYAAPDIEEALLDDMQGLVGACSYARCCAIYAAASAELCRRRLSECEEPEDDRDELEKRRDGEAEDAERKLDEEKAA